MSEKVPRQVPKESCQQVPRQSCSTQYNSIPKESCSQVPRQKCQSIPRKECKKVPIQVNMDSNNEVSTRHDMNYGQVRYPNLVDKIINFAKRTFVWHLIKKWLDQKKLQMIKKSIWHHNFFFGLFFVKKNPVTFPVDP